MPLNKGDTVMLAGDAANTFPTTDQYYRRTIQPGTIGTVTSVRSYNTRNVKFAGEDRVLIVERQDVEAVSPDRIEEIRAEKAAQREAERAAREAEAERIRMLTEPKEGDILPDDPRLDWMWAKIEADKGVKEYCHVYDQITDRLGLPGRTRNFTVHFEMNGIAAQSSIQARNHGQAQAKLREAMPEAQNVH